MHLGLREAEGDGVAVRPQEPEPARGIPLGAAAVLEGEEHDVGPVLLAEVRGPGKDFLVGGRPPDHGVVAAWRESDMPVEPVDLHLDVFTMSITISIKLEKKS